LIVAGSIRHPDPRSDRTADTFGRAEQTRRQVRIACCYGDRGKRFAGAAFS